jgi:hypothetical protein
VLLIECDGCGTKAFAECSCPPGWDPVAQGQHIPAVVVAGMPAEACPFGNPDAQVTCPPGSACCKEDHDHAQPCPLSQGGHGACPEPQTCKLWANATADFRHPSYTGPPPGPCPGGHCHKDLEDCTGCRALTLIMVPGSAQIYPVAALGA